jgi:hypothetical protein
MKKIISIFLHNLRNEAHFEFMLLFGNLFDAFPPVRTIVAALYVTFYDLLQQESKLVDAQRTSPYTAEILKADAHNDRLLIGIREIILGSMHHFDAVVVEAATRLFDRLKSFKSITAKSYEEEAAAIRILIADFQGAFAADAATVGITGWIVELAQGLAEFERLLKQRNDETAAREPKSKLTEVRRALDEVYHQMVARINAAALLDDTQTYTPFIQQLNAEIAYFNEHSHRRAKRNIKKANLAPIPVQIQERTGKPVMPIPVVYYEDTELVFTKDFNLTYKNNDKPGTATLILHGKGLYHGQKEATFNIESDKE